MEPRNTPSSQLTILISLTAVFSFLVSLLLMKAPVPWGGIFQPQDDLAHDFRGREPGRLHETLMIAKDETSIDFYGASERWI